MLYFPSKFPTIRKCCGKRLDLVSLIIWKFHNPKNQKFPDVVLHHITPVEMCILKIAIWHILNTCVFVTFHVLCWLYALRYTLYEKAVENFMTLFSYKFESSMIQNINKFPYAVLHPIIAVEMSILKIAKWHILNYCVFVTFYVLYRLYAFEFE